MRETPTSHPIVYCVLPRDLVELHPLLSDFYGDEPSVRVIVEQRGRDRRSAGSRRTAEGEAAAVERRRIRSAEGRRMAPRRATAIDAPPPRPLPVRARRHASRIVFIERLEPDSAQQEDTDSNRIVARVQAGDRMAFGDLYMRHFDRVFSYLALAMRDFHAAEDTTQQVFLRALLKIGDYQIRTDVPFRAWLLGIARFESLNYMRKHRPVDLIPLEELDRLIGSELSDFDRSLLDAMTNVETIELVARMPKSQIQILALRYVLGFRFVEIAAMVGRTAASVRQLHHRALVALERGMEASAGVSVAGRSRRLPLRAPNRQSVPLRSRRFVLTRSLGAPALSRGLAAFSRAHRW